MRIARVSKLTDPFRKFCHASREAWGIVVVTTLRGTLELQEKRKPCCPKTKTNSYRRCVGSIALLGSALSLRRATKRPNIDQSLHTTY